MTVQTEALLLTEQHSTAVPSRKNSECALWPVVR